MILTRISVKKYHWAILAIFIVGLVILLFPNTDDKCSHQILMARTLSWYELQVPQVDTLYFREMSPEQPLEGLTSRREEACDEQWSNAFFISFSGRILAAADTTAITRKWTLSRFRSVMEYTARSADTRLAYYEGLRKEMAYYNRTHTVVDDGYHIVMDYNEQIRGRLSEWLRMAACIDSVIAGKPYKIVRKRTHDVFARIQSDNDSLTRLSCRLLSEKSSGLAVWQVRNDMLPLGASRFRVNAIPYTWFHPSSHLYRIWGYWGHHDQMSLTGDVEAGQVMMPLSDGRFALPLVEGSENAPVFDWAGQLVGVNHKGMLVPSYKLWWQIRNGETFGSCFFENVKAWFVRAWVMIEEVCS